MACDRVAKVLARDQVKDPHRMPMSSITWHVPEHKTLQIHSMTPTPAESLGKGPQTRDLCLGGLQLASATLPGQVGSPGDSSPTGKPSCTAARRPRIGSPRLRSIHGPDYQAERRTPILRSDSKSPTAARPLRGLLPPNQTYHATLRRDPATDYHAVFF